MSWIMTKYLLTAGVVVLVSEVAARSGKAGALVAALPMISVLSLIWLHVDRQPADRIASFATYTFWYVVPTLPMFLVFPALLPRIGFWLALLLSLTMTALLIFAFAFVLRRFDISLL